MQASPIAERLTRLRIERGLSIDEVAAKTGIDPTLIAEIEDARSAPTGADLQALGDAYGVDVLDVFRQDGIRFQDYA